MAKTSKPEFKGAFELFKPSMEIIRNNLSLYFVLLVLPLLLVSLDSTSTELMSPFVLGGSLLSLLFLAPLLYAEVRNASGKTVTLGESFSEGYKYFWRTLGLVIVVGLIIFLGLIAFIVPGIIFMRRYLLSPYYLIDRNLSIGEAMKASETESKPFANSIYSVLGVSILIALVSIFGMIGAVISTILSVLYNLAYALRYVEIKKAYKAL